MSDERPLLSVFEATKRLVKDVAPEVVAEAVQSALFDPMVYLTRQDLELMGRTVDAVVAVAPPFISSPHFIEEMERLNAHSVWKTLYNNSDLVTQRIGAPTTDKKDGPLAPMTAYDYIRWVSGANYNFFVPHSVALAGSVFGIEMADKLKLITKGETKKQYDPAIRLAEAFFTPPQNIQETIARLQIVFPDPAQPKVMPSGFDGLVKDTIFKQYIQVHQKVGICPAPNITEQLYSEFGKHLRSDYQAKYIERVEKK